jgi:NAD(P)-dependent dehydrogenase (short-subunit alcohol dehydrogenase family)
MTKPSVLSCQLTPDMFIGRRWYVWGKSVPQPRPREVKREVRCSLPWSVVFFSSHSAMKERIIAEVRLSGIAAFAKFASTYVGDSFTVTSGTIYERPIPGMSIGSGIAGAVVTAAKGLAVDLAPIRVNCIAPGVVDTELWDAVYSSILLHREFC